MESLHQLRVIKLGLVEPRVKILQEHTMKLIWPTGMKLLCDSSHSSVKTCCIVSYSHRKSWKHQAAKSLAVPRAHEGCFAAEYQSEEDDLLYETHELSQTATSEEWLNTKGHVQFNTQGCLTFDFSFLMRWASSMTMYLQLNFLKVAFSLRIIS